MKLFGWKSAGRDVRPVLARYGLWSAGGSSGEWADDYAAQVRQGYCRNAVAQRAVRLVAQGLAGAPVTASSPELLALVSARSGGQALTETVAAHLLLHGIPWRRSTCRWRHSAARCAYWPPASAMSPGQPRRKRRSRAHRCCRSRRSPCAGAAVIAWTRRSRAGWRWIDGVDSPLVEERELYRVTIGTVPSIETGEPTLTLAAAERGATVSIRQVGSAGTSPAANLFIPAWEA